MGGGGEEGLITALSPNLSSSPANPRKGVAEPGGSKGFSTIAGTGARSFGDVDDASSTDALRSASGVGVMGSGSGE